MASKRPAENEEDVPILKKSTFTMKSSFQFKPSTLDPAKNKDQKKNPFLKPSSFANPFAKSTVQPVKLSSDNPFLNVSVDESQDEDEKSEEKDEDSKKRKADESNTSELSDSKVAKTEEKSEDEDKTKVATKTFGDKNSNKFVFGQKLAERAKVDEGNGDDKSPLISFSTVQTKEEGESSTQEASEEDLKKLEDDAAEQFAAINNKEIAPEIDIKTGEEDEKCVLQVMCKLYQYDNKSQSWKERGVGKLHLNDSINSEQSHSRLVMRSKGSMRLVLNTKIWADMSLTRANKKSIRVSARTQDGEIGVFLLQGSISDMTQMWQAVDYRVVRAKFARDKQREKEEGETPETSNGDSQGEQEKEKLPKEKTEEGSEDSK